MGGFVADVIHIRIDVKTVRGLNAREHWAVRARRVRNEHDQTRVAWIRAGKPKLKTPAIVTITRHSVQLMDDDNLPGATKAIRDELAEIAGVDDGSAALRFEYAQVRLPRRQQWVTVDWMAK